MEALKYPWWYADLDTNPEPDDHHHHRIRPARIKKERGKEEGTKALERCK